MSVLGLVHLITGEPRFAEKANEMTDRARKFGPNRLRQTARQDAGGKLVKPADAHPPLPPTKHGKLIRDAERVEEA